MHTHITEHLQQCSSNILLFYLRQRVIGKFYLLAFSCSKLLISNLKETPMFIFIEVEENLSGQTYLKNYTSLDGHFYISGRMQVSFSQEDCYKMGNCKTDTSIRRAWGPPGGHWIPISREKIGHIPISSEKFSIFLISNFPPRHSIEYFVFD